MILGRADVHVRRRPARAKAGTGASEISRRPQPITEVDFAPPDLGDAEIQEVVDVLRSGWLSTGPRVERFEGAFAAYIGCPHAVAVNSCTAALHLSLLAAGVGPGDEVVTTPLTFCADANVILHAGATPIFADVDPVTMNLTADAAAEATTDRTRAWLPVHFAGRPVDAAAFRSGARQRGVTLVEDAAHCVEGHSAGEKIGATADLTCFSFYATKNLAAGEGGMVTTASPEWAERIRMASLHGMTRAAWSRYRRASASRYDVMMPGFKYNMPDLQAAIGLHQLASIERRLRRREAIWRRYDEGLADLPIERPAPCRTGDRHARHLYTILVDETESGWSRDRLQDALRTRGISTSVHFTPVHLHSYYAERYGYRPGMFPVAESIGRRTLSLPLSSGLRDAAVDRVIHILRELLT
jgi:dTDP-4-amino-4,6-dideoxygalactose transaminase